MLLGLGHVLDHLEFAGQTPLEPLQAEFLEFQGLAHELDVLTLFSPFL